MKILIALTYYRPHISGLTLHVEWLATALAERGHHVTVLTSRYDHNLPRQELTKGVRVVRVPVAARISKGWIMPAFGEVARALLREHELVNIHMPQIDAPGLAFWARVFGKPAVLTYHCDLHLPAGIFNRVVNSVVQGADYVAATLANRIVTSTEDYARHSPLLSKFRSKWFLNLPPIFVPERQPGATEAFTAQWDFAHHRPNIGVVARLAAEKGVHVLLHALPQLVQEFPQLRVLFVGPDHKAVVGEEAYAAQLAPLFERYRDHVAFTGVLKPHELAAFYENCDLTVLPSLNSTESFGAVQAESMLHGTPVVASDRPGVRQPILMSGMGELAPPGDSDGLAQAILKVLHNRAAYVQPHTKIADLFSLDRTITRYEQVFREELQKARCHCHNP